MDNATAKREELACPYWYKKCSEVNSPKPVCRKLMPVSAMPLGGIAPQQMMVCQDDLIFSRLENIFQLLQNKSEQPARSIINDILRGNRGLS